MKLTDTERLILANQYEILAKLDSSLFYKNLSENLRDGHEFIYENKISIEPIFDEEASTFVLDTLSLYQALQLSYTELMEKDNLTEEQVKFPGFDGNNESEYMCFFEALIKDGRFSSLKAEANSHMPKLERYLRMLAKWKALDQSFELSLEDIQNILEY